MLEAIAAQYDIRPNVSTSPSNSENNPASVTTEPIHPKGWKAFVAECDKIADAPSLDAISLEDEAPTPLHQWSDRFTKIRAPLFSSYKKVMVERVSQALEIRQ